MPLRLLLPPLQRLCQVDLRQGIMPLLLILAEAVKAVCGALPSQRGAVQALPAPAAAASGAAP